MHNKKIIEILTRLKILRQLENNKNVKHQIAAYDRVINGIINYPADFKSEDEIINNIPGIGANIKKYLQQIFDIDNQNDQYHSGIYELDTYLTTNIDFFNKIAILANFIQIPHVGLSTAERLYNKGYRNYDDLIRNEPKIANNLKYQQELIKRIPRAKITRFSEMLQQYLEGSQIFFTITGSYRREKATSGDIDIIFYGSDVSNAGRKLVERLIENHVIISTDSLGDEKFLGTIYLDDENPAVHADFLFINNQAQYPYALLYFTGSKEFNVWMKDYAKSLGYTLGNTNMYYTDSNGYIQYIYVNTEQDIFTFLGIPYVEPSQRERS